MRRKITKLMTLILIVMFTFMNNVTAFALSNDSKKITDFDEAITLIEKEYLITNSDGTHSISKEARKHIDNELLDSIIEGTNYVNQRIVSKELINFSNSSTLISAARSSGPFIYDEYVTYYNWQWWGFYANLNYSGAVKLRNDLNIALVKYSGQALTDAIWVVADPTKLSVMLLGVSTVKVLGVMGWIEECNSAISDGQGVTVTCTGAPGEAILRKVNRW